MQWVVNSIDWSYASFLGLILILAFTVGDPLNRKFSVIVAAVWIAINVGVISGVALGLTGYAPWILFMALDILAVIFLLKKPTNLLGAVLAVLFLWQIFCHIGFGFWAGIDGADRDARTLYRFVLNGFAYTQLLMLGIGSLFDDGIGARIMGGFGFVRGLFHPIRPDKNSEDSS